MGFLIEAFLIGFLGSFHCIGMCGPIVLALSPKNHQKNGNVLWYHFGKTASYILLGLLFGLLGKGIYLAGLQQRISILTGFFLLITVFFSKKRVDQVLDFAFQKPYQFIKLKLGKHLTTNKRNRYLFTGIFNGFLPCGLVYIALLSAFNTANLFKGALVMLFFGLGTFPALFFVEHLFVKSKQLLGNKINYIIKGFTIILALLFIIRGLGMGGYFSPLESDLNLNSFIKSCIQIIN